MNQRTDKERDPKARILRLRERIKEYEGKNAISGVGLVPIVKGILDLLEDEL